MYTTYIVHNWVTKKKIKAKKKKGKKTTQLGRFKGPQFYQK